MRIEMGRHSGSGNGADKIPHPCIGMFPYRKNLLLLPDIPDRQYHQFQPCPVHPVLEKNDLKKIPSLYAGCYLQSNVRYSRRRAPCTSFPIEKKSFFLRSW